jgi:hypothetical protein
MSGGIPKWERGAGLKMKGRFVFPEKRVLWRQFIIAKPTKIFSGHVERSEASQAGQERPFRQAQGRLFTSTRTLRSG